MSDTTPPIEDVPDPLLALQERAARLERELSQAQQQATERLLRAELKSEAVRAGMIDLDGLKLVDLSKVTLGADGELVGGARVMAEMKRAKPWLFSAPFSSSPQGVPPAQPPRQKLATEMSDEEYRAARAAILRPRP
jgi:hypothetical protein